MNMQFNNQNQSSCDCNSGQNNGSMFNMNSGNPQQAVNLNNHIAGQHNINQLTQQLDLNNSMGIPTNMLDKNNSVNNNNGNNNVNNSNDVKKDLINSLNKISSRKNNTLKGAVEDSYYILLKNINLAFILVAAFAWNDAVKFYIAKLIRSHQGSPYYYLYYALIVTLLAVLSVRLTRKFLIGN